MKVHPILPLALALITAAAAGCAHPSPHPPASKRLAVWIDTDPSVGIPERDVDDGLALVQAFHSPELQIVGVSAVFGNAPLAQTFPIAREIARRFGPDQLSVTSGASSSEDLGRETPASRALASALRERRLIILALGPATNVATTVKNHPELAERVVEIVAVAGRRPDQRFTTGTTNPKAHRDFNFELDDKAFQVLLDSRIPLTLTPFEISSKVWIREDDLRRLEAGGPAARFLAGPARGWLNLWERTFGVDGFNPFDTLAVAVVATPGMIQCENLPAKIETQPDDVTEERMQGTRSVEKPYLLAAKGLSPARDVRYCHTPEPAYKDDLMRRLLAGD